MSLRIPTTAANLLDLGRKMYAGLLLLVGELKITQLTAESFFAILTAFQKADDNSNAARSAEQVASTAYKDAMNAIDLWLAAVKGVLLAHFGSGYTTEWVQAGFTNNSTQIPATIADRMALTARLVAFLTRNPSFEVPAINVTQKEGTRLADVAEQKRQEVTRATRATKDFGTAWQTAFQALADEEWTLIKLLQATLADDDTRWLEFGLAMPATSTTPGQVMHVSAQLDANGAIIVNWDATPLATRYRVRMLIVGVEENYALVASKTETMALINGVSPGQTVQIIVQAVNVNRQGVASDPIQFTVLLPSRAVAPEAKAAPAPAAPELGEIVISSTGHGTNGHHGNGSRELIRN